MQKFFSMVAREFREALPAMLFFLVLFHLVSLTKVVVLDDYSVTALRATAATVAALLVAKAILVVEALPVGRWFAGRLLPHVLWKTVLFALLVLVFRILEEALPLLWREGAPGAAARAMLEEVDWPVFWVVAVWIVWGLLLYCLLTEAMARAAPAARVDETQRGATPTG